ncbi:MAG: ABC transporter ATP-binding protein [Polyangiaceae bacterium]|nr:ABC transporter ATP-binding protein [Polyangiaceae bacterium]
MAESVLELLGVEKAFGAGALTNIVLRDINLRVDKGELTAIIGPSGSGKSTLLNIIGLLTSPTRGDVRLLGEQVAALDDDSLTRLRSLRIGFIFQFHHLLGGLTAAQNVMLPLMIERGRRSEDLLERAMGALTEVGMAHKADARPSQMSGGEQQRVAVARALVKNPPLVLADEPTGNLDTENSEKVFELMRRYNRERGTAFVIVTHDNRIAERCRRVVEVVDGRIQEDRRLDAMS